MPNSPVNWTARNRLVTWVGRLARASDYLDR